MGSKEMDGINGDLLVIMPGIISQFRGYIRETLDLRAQGMRLKRENFNSVPVLATKDNL